MNIVLTAIFVHDFRKYLSEISGHLKATLSWVLGNSDIVRNWIANELARARTEFSTFDILQDIGVAVVLLKLNIVYSLNTEA